MARQPDDDDDECTLCIFVFCLAEVFMFIYCNYLLSYYSALYVVFVLFRRYYPSSV